MKTKVLEYIENCLIVRSWFGVFSICFSFGAACWLSAAVINALRGRFRIGSFVEACLSLVIGCVLYKGFVERNAKTIRSNTPSA